MTGSAEYGCRGYSPGSECPWSWSLPRCPRHYQTPDQTSCNYLKGKRETPVNAHSMFLYTAHPSKHTALALPTDSDGIYFSLNLKSGLFTFENISHLFQLSLWDDKVILVLLVFLKGRQTWILDTDRKIQAESTQCGPCWRLQQNSCLPVCFLPEHSPYGETSRP